MRTISAQDDRVLSSRNRSVHLRILVEDGAATFIDLTKLESRDWVLGAQWGENVDTPVSTASVQLFRESYNLSLASLISTSKFNQPSKLLEVARGIKIETATLPKDQTPTDGDFELQFEGKIDKIDWGASRSVIRLSCRDLAGELMDEFVENQTIHGTGIGEAVEVTIQDILDTHAVSAPTLFIPGGSPGFAVTEYLQQKEQILNSTRKLSQLIGADTRYRWDNGTDTIRFTLVVPERASPTVDREFDASDYRDLPGIVVSREKIRNVVKVVFTDGVTGIRTTTIRTDASSITRYGRRFMEIAEASNSQIDSLAEANAFGDAALDDLKEPDLDHGVEIDYFGKIQLADYYRFKSNGIHYDSDQELAVVEFRHAVDKEKARTTMMLRGKPSTGVRRWLEIEARPGVAPAPDLVGPAKPTVTVSPGMGSITLTYDAPAESDWATTEVYLDTSTIAATTYPTKPSPTLLVATGRQSRFEIVDLVPGTTYFARLIVLDLKGNFVETADVVTEATQRVGPHHENTDGQQDGFLRNNDFNIHTLDETTNPPDFWSVTSGVYGSSDDVYFTSVNTETGNRAISLEFTGTDNFPSVESGFLPFTVSDLIRMGIVARATGANGSPDVRVRIRYYDLSKTIISSDSTIISLTGTFLPYLTSLDEAPSGTRYVTAEFSPESSLGTDFTLEVDKCSLLRGMAFFTGASLGTPALSGSFQDITFSVTSDVGFVGGPTGSRTTATAQHPGSYTVNLTGFAVDEDGDDPDWELDLELRVNGSSVLSFEAVSLLNGAGDYIVNVSASDVIFLDEGDDVTVAARALETTVTDNLTHSIGIGIEQLVRIEI